MKRIVGNPWVGLVSLGGYVAVFILIDAFIAAEKAGQDIPGALPSALRGLGVVCIVGIVLAQRHSALQPVWRAMNTLTLALLAVFLRGALRRYESGEWNGAGNGLQIAEGLCRRLVEIDAREEAADGDAR